MDKKQRTALLVAASTLGPLGKFKRSGGSLSDFVDSQSDENDSGIVAAKILEYFCIEDGEYNDFALGVQLALAFLEKTMIGPGDQAQRLQCIKGLKTALDTGTTQEILKWVVAHYR